jgi:1-deoxyxylulose-5-phosphate synthase
LEIPEWMYPLSVWMLQKSPVVALVIGATKLSHLESVVEALSVRLSPEEMAYLEEPYVPHPLVGLIPYGGQLLSARK